MITTRIYLAAASAEHERVTRMARLLEQYAAVELVDRWWETASAWTGRDRLVERRKQREIAHGCLNGIMRSHVLWLLFPRDYSDGAMCEFMFAVRAAPALRTVVTGRDSSRTVFTSLADFRDESDDVGLYEVTRIARMRAEPRRSP